LIQKIFRLTQTSVVLAVLALVMIAAPAGAHQSEVSQGNDFAVTASDHRSGSVCDQERDGHFVSATWRDAEGFRVGYEEDGGDSGCDEISFNGKASTVVVCEIGVGDFACSDTHKV
jgi:hypothetical protein